MGDPFDRRRGTAGAWREVCGAFRSFAVPPDREVKGIGVDFFLAANDILRGLPADTPAWEPEIPSQVRNEAQVE